MLFKVRTMLSLGPLAWWWSLSPNNFNGSNANVWGVSGLDGGLFHIYLGNGKNNFSRGVRPSLSLQSGVKISSGNGSATNPYKIAI